MRTRVLPHASKQDEASETSSESEDDGREQDEVSKTKTPEEDVSSSHSSSVHSERSIDKRICLIHSEIKMKLLDGPPISSTAALPYEVNANPIFNSDMVGAIFSNKVSFETRQQYERFCHNYEEQTQTALEVKPANDLSITIVNNGVLGSLLPDEYLSGDILTLCMKLLISQFPQHIADQIVLLPEKALNLCLPQGWYKIDRETEAQNYDVLKVLSDTMVTMLSPTFRRKKGFVPALQKLWLEVVGSGSPDPIDYNTIIFYTSLQSVPVPTGKHYALFIIFPQSKTIEAYDPMDFDPCLNFTLALHGLLYWFSNSTEATVNPDEWTLVHRRENAYLYVTDSKGCAFHVLQILRHILQGRKTSSITWTTETYADSRINLLFLLQKLSQPQPKKTVITNSSVVQQTLNDVSDPNDPLSSLTDKLVRKESLQTGTSSLKKALNNPNETSDGSDDGLFSDDKALLPDDDVHIPPYEGITSPSPDDNLPLTTLPSHHPTGW